VADLRLVFICQAVDAADPVHATTVRWIEVLSRHPAVKQLTVLALRTGEHQLPPQVTIRRIGNGGPVRSLARFYLEVARALRRGADAFFVHQGGPYPVLLLPAKVLLRKPIYHWKAHPYVSRLTAFEARWCDDLVFTSSSGAFPLDLPNRRIVGQGVDTEMFRITQVEKSQDLVTSGRIAPVKRIDQMIRAIAEANRGHGARYRFDLYGSSKGQEAYEDKVRSLIEKEGLESLVLLHGPTRQDELPGILNRHRVFLHFSAGAIDRAAVEAMACGLPVLTSNANVAGLIPSALRPELVVPQEDTAAQAEALHLLLSTPGDRLAEIGRELREVVVREHGVEGLFDRIVAEVEQDLIRRRRSPAGRSGHTPGRSHGGVGRRPRVVLVGKSVIATQAAGDLRRKFEILGRHLDPTIVAVGPPGIAQLGPARIVRLPQLAPPALGGLVFYGIAPIAALVAAASRKASAIVCQSPFEGLGVIALTRALPRSARPRVVIEVHGDWRTAARLYGSEARRSVAGLADKLSAWTVARADRVRVVSRELEGLVRDSGYKGTVDRFPAYIDFARFMDDSLRPLPSTPRALFAGVFQRYKGVDVLIHAWEVVAAALPEARLIMAGGGPMWRDIGRRVRALGLETCIELSGPLSREGVLRELDRSSCLVMASRAEGTPRLIIEAMARARAVVATAVGGVPELVTSGVTGALVPPEDPEALGRALIRLLSDPQALERMGVAARRAVMDLAPGRQYEAGIERLSDWLRSGSR
jgi:glycosyltransferase involved in cell wall biosynthesis